MLTPRRAARAAVFSLWALAGPAWASNQGGGGAVLLLAGLFALPVLCLVIQMALTIALLVMRGSARGRTTAKISVALGIVTLGLLLLGSVMLKGASFGPWTGVVLLLAVAGIVVAALHLKRLG